MSRRTNGRRHPSRNARVERRKAERGPRTQMAIPDAIVALTPPRPPRRLPCLVDPKCPIDHLNRKRGARRG